MLSKPIDKNYLFYGDNLNILRDWIPNESVDLIYLDPPFNSNRSYNVLFRDESGKESEAQITAFDDTWHWGPSAEEAYHQLVIELGGQVGEMIAALRSYIGENQMMAYLVMMAIRLIELHRILKPTGSLYLHCDPTASHYLKIILDTIFEPKNFINEIIWKRTYAHGDAGGQEAKHFGRVHDIIFYFAKDEGNQYFNPIYQPYEPEYIEQTFKYQDPDGRRWQSLPMDGPGGAAKGNPRYEVMGVTRYWRYSKIVMQELIDKGLVYQSKPGAVPRRKGYLDESPGVLAQDIWTDIKKIASQAKERLGYPTQKPLALLERIIEVSCPPNGFVLDPFCGCGTAVAAAHKLDRRWVGIDITNLSISLLKYRLKDMFGEIEYEVIGEPVSVSAANQLAKDDRYQFQWWALSLIKAKPLGGRPGGRQGKKGSDKGVDGVITFIDEAKERPKRVLVQVKSGHVKSGDIRDLRGTVDREGDIGVFITLEPPSKDMEVEAVSAGFYHSASWGKKYPKLQILTIEQLLTGAQVQMPPSNITFREAERVKKKGSEQMGLFD